MKKTLFLLATLLASISFFTPARMKALKQKALPNTSMKLNSGIKKEQRDLKLMTAGSISLEERGLSPAKINSALQKIMMF